MNRQEKVAFLNAALSNSNPEILDRLVLLMTTKEDPDQLQDPVTKEKFKLKALGNEVKPMNIGKFNKSR